jgi:hypothetical protein
MDPFWASLFEHLKHCGRSATLFILALAGLWFFLAVVIYAANLHEYLLPELPGIVLLAAAWEGVVNRRARARRRGRLHYSPLSRDELCVARSKLKKDRSRTNSLWVLL